VSIGRRYQYWRQAFTVPELTINIATLINKTSTSHHITGTLPGGPKKVTPLKKLMKTLKTQKK